MRIDKNPHSTFQKNFKRHVDLLLIEEKDQFHHVLIKDYNTFIYNQILYRGRKDFRSYCLQSFSTAQIVERHDNDWFQVNGKQKIKMAKKYGFVNPKIKIMLSAVLFINYCVDDQFSLPFKSYLGQDVVHKFITNMVEESQYCSHVMKEHFNKELFMTSKDNEIFRSSAKC